MSPEQAFLWRFYLRCLREGLRGHPLERYADVNLSRMTCRVVPDGELPGGRVREVGPLHVEMEAGTLGLAVEWAARQREAGYPGARAL